MKAIVCVDKDWGIGRNGELLERIPDDMKFFKSMTINNIIVMGRKTFESLPNKKPLKDRINIVLSKDTSFNNDDVVICRSVEETLEKIKELKEFYIKKECIKDVFIIGGEDIYKQFIKYCSAVIITKINKSYNADKFFPNLDNNNDWVVRCQGFSRTYKDIEYKLFMYSKRD